MLHQVILERVALELVPQALISLRPIGQEPGDQHNVVLGGAIQALLEAQTRLDLIETQPVALRVSLASLKTNSPEILTGIAVTSP